MEEDHPNAALVWALLLILLLTALTRNAIHTEQLQRDHARDQELLRQVEMQNRDLTEAVVNLRTLMVDLITNLSERDMRLQACTEDDPECSAPPHRVPIDRFLITQDRVIIDVQDVMAGVVAPTGSMEPVLSANTTVLETAPESPSDVLPGDIIIYELGDDRIIHRVLETGWDAQGWYAVTKGDNNERPDPDRVRFPQVRGVVVGIIY